jgi:hypothetical protein
MGAKACYRESKFPKNGMSCSCLSVTTTDEIAASPIELDRYRQVGISVGIQPDERLFFYVNADGV